MELQRYTVKQFTDKEIDLEDMEYLTDPFNISLSNKVC